MSETTETTETTGPDPKAVTESVRKQLIRVCEATEEYVAALRAAAEINDAVAKRRREMAKASLPWIQENLTSLTLGVILEETDARLAQRRDTLCLEEARLTDLIVVAGALRWEVAPDVLNLARRLSEILPSARREP